MQNSTLDGITANTNIFTTPSSLSLSSSSCPCCIFYLQNKNLFLPQSMIETTSFIENNDTVGTSTTGTSSQNYDDNDDFGNTVVHNNNETNTMKSPLHVLEEITKFNRNVKQQQQPEQQNPQQLIRLFDTHEHAHLNGISIPLYYHNEENDKNSINQHDNDPNFSLIKNEMDKVTISNTVISTDFDSCTPQIVSITCSVQELDWDDCIQYVSQSKYRIGAIGIHPWYVSEDLANDIDTTSTNTWITKLEYYLQNHTNCIIGEIGLCKVSKFVRTHDKGKQHAIQIQRIIFYKQLQLATHYQRPVSIHCVQLHTILLEVLYEFSTSSTATAINDNKEGEEKQEQLYRVPPCIVLHSFSGSAHQVKQLLQWEASLYSDSKEKKKKKKKWTKNKEHDSNINDSAASTMEQNRVPLQDKEQDQPPPILYFGFSHCINYNCNATNKQQEQYNTMIRSIPMNRIVVESDVQNSNNTILGTCGSIAYLSWVLNISIIDIATITYNNATRFMSQWLLESKNNNNKIE